MYQVEVRLDGNPAILMFEVYRWLGDRKIQPPLCRHRVAGQTVTFHLSFAAAAEADAFATRFRTVPACGPAHLEHDPLALDCAVATKR